MSLTYSFLTVLAFVGPAWAFASSCRNTRVAAELKPFVIPLEWIHVVVGLASTRTGLQDNGSAIALGLDVLLAVLWTLAVVHDDDDDDDDDLWKRRRRRAAAKVKSVGGRLVVVPEPAR